jgi:Zn-dependent protease with chaperone function
MEQHDRGPYIETLTLEAFLSAFRFLPAMVVAAVIGGMIGFPLFALFDINDEDALILAMVWGGILLALSPVIASVLTLTVLPGGYGLTRRELGAREPSVREREELLGALQELTETAPTGTIEPSRWLVIDAIDPNALVVGTTIYVHRGLFRTPYFLPALAHELGHLNHDDGRLVLALRRLVPPPLSYLTLEGGGCLPLALKLCGGGFGLSLMTPFWNRYWQKRELLADRFAFECGQADGLIEFLDVYQFFDVAVPFHDFASTHPYSETRIDHLRDYLEEEAAAPAKPVRAAKPRLRQPVPSESRPGGFTDEEAFLDLAFLDEAHVGWSPTEQIMAEKAWIRANGRRLVDVAHYGKAKVGHGFLTVRWDSSNADTRMADVSFSDRADYLAVARNAESVRDHWAGHIATYDSARSVVVAVGRFSGQGVGHYFMAMRDGEALPASGEKPPGRR